MEGQSIKNSEQRSRQRMPIRLAREEGGRRKEERGRRKEERRKRKKVNPERGNAVP